MKRRIYILFSIFCIIVLFFETVQAGISPIWQIGDPNNYSSLEFDDPDTRIIEYNVPKNWRLLRGQSDPNWNNFPKYLYPFGDHENVPQEIIIKFDYLEDYSITTLEISATIPYEEPNIRLELFKGEKGEDFIGEKNIERRIGYFSYDFPLGFIKKGLHDKNKIFLRNSGPSNTPIFFDYISLYETDDSDRDGVSDIDEGDCSLDESTACIPIKSFDPNSSVKKKIILHIDKSEGTSPRFRGVKFLDPNTLNLPGWLITGRYFPYGFLSFKVEEIKTLDKINIQISVTDPPIKQLYPFARFYTYQDSNNWEETGFVFLDKNTAKIPLNDGGEGDFDKEKDGNINTNLGISYPRTLNLHVEERGCFIKTIVHGSDYEKDF